MRLNKTGKWTVYTLTAINLLLLANLTFVLPAFIMLMGLYTIIWKLEMN